jgi:uncharacterized NAD-dependent epimerase/dehydratase family protein
MDKKTRGQYRAAWIALKYLVPVNSVTVNGTQYIEVGKRLQKKSLRAMFDAVGGDAAIEGLNQTAWNVTLKRTVYFKTLLASNGVAGLSIVAPVSVEAMSNTQDSPSPVTETVSQTETV